MMASTVWRPRNGEKPKKHAERERGGRALRRVVDVQQRVEPAADQRLRQMNHRK